MLTDRLKTFQKGNLHKTFIFCLMSRLGHPLHSVKLVGIPGGFYHQGANGIFGYCMEELFINFCKDGGIWNFTLIEELPVKCAYDYNGITQREYTSLDQAMPHLATWLREL